MPKIIAKSNWVVLTAFFLAAISILNMKPVFAGSKDVQIETQAKAVNINTAGSQELQVLRGVGPAIAERIIQYRQEHGRFEHAEDLTKVHGIGQAKFQKIKAQVSI